MMHVLGIALTLARPRPESTLLLIVYIAAAHMLPSRARPLKSLVATAHRGREWCARAVGAQDTEAVKDVPETSKQTNDDCVTLAIAHSCVAATAAAALVLNVAAAVTSASSAVASAPAAVCVVGGIADGRARHGTGAGGVEARTLFLARKDRMATARSTGTLSRRTRAEAASRRRHELKTAHLGAALDWTIWITIRRGVPSHAARGHACHIFGARTRRQPRRKFRRRGVAAAIQRGHTIAAELVGPAALATVPTTARIALPRRRRWRHVRLPSAAVPCPLALVVTSEQVGTGMVEGGWDPFGHVSS